MNTVTEMWAGIIGFFLPVVLSFIQQEKWDDRTKAIVAFIACLIAGTGTAYFTGGLNTADWSFAVLTVLTVSIATYKGFWQKIRDNQ